MKKIVKFLSKIILCTIVVVTLGASSGFAASNAPTGEIGNYGKWTTDYNRSVLINTAKQDMQQFQAGLQAKQLVKDYVPVEAKIGLALMKALSSIGKILDVSLVRFTIIFILIAYIFWVTLEAYYLIKTGANARKTVEKIIKKGALVAIWLIILQASPAQIFMWIMAPIISISSYLSDLILNSVTSITGVALPDTCGAIHAYVAAHPSSAMLIDANSAASILCVPTRLSGVFYTAVAAGWHWMVEAIGHSAFTFVVGATFVVLFVYNIFKFAFMALGVIVDLFLVVFMLPFTAITETLGKTPYNENLGETSYKGIAGTIYDGFIALFKAESLQVQIMRFVNAAIYFVSLSIVVALCVALLSGIINTNLASEIPTFDNLHFMTALLTGLLVSYFANQSDKIAKNLGGNIRAEFGDKVKGSLKTLRDDALNWVKTTYKDVKGKS